MPTPVLIIHGGAGAISRKAMPSDLERDYRSALESVLRIGIRVLAGGGASLDAVETAVAALEDNPLFNAGRGAVFTSAGTHELEASIMDGRTGMAGAVSGLRRIANPVRLARRVMERTRHVMLAGEGAEAFAAAQGVELVDNSFFSTDYRRRQLEHDRSRQGASLSEDHPTPPPFPNSDCGTVGAVALDRAGNLAAATSTGGMSNKPPGRVGDSPLIGLGCYASNATCAVSVTGHGEFIMRHVVAYDIAARMEYLRQSPREAADQAIRVRLAEAGGRGGAIVLGADGRYAMTFNSEGMYRGRIEVGGVPEVGIYANE